MPARIIPLFPSGQPFPPKPLQINLTELAVPTHQEIRSLLKIVRIQTIGQVPVVEGLTPLESLERMVA